MDRWVGKLALVTGASVGIGCAIAENLVKQGVNVVGCARNIEKLKEIEKKLEKESGKFHPFQCDLRKEDDILSMFKFIKEKFGALHICVNNAGLAHKASLLEGSTEKWRDMLDVNVVALSIVTRESIAVMRANDIDDGHVININSMSGHRLTSNSMYGASKFAVTALTEGLRKELRGIKSHIRSTSISPGIVETEFAARSHPNDPDYAKHFYSKVESLQGSDIADAVVFVLSSPAHMDVNEIYIRPVEQTF